MRTYHEALHTNISSCGAWCKWKNINLFLHLVCHKGYTIAAASEYCDIIKDDANYAQALKKLPDVGDVEDIHFIGKQRFVVLEHHYDHSVTSEQKVSAVASYSKYVRVLWVNNEQIQRITHAEGHRMWLAVKCVLTGEMCSGLSAIAYDVSAKEVAKHVKFLTQPHGMQDINKGTTDIIESLFVKECADAKTKIMKLNKNEYNEIENYRTLNYTDCLVNLGSKKGRSTLDKLSQLNIGVHMVVDKHLGVDWVSQLLSLDPNQLLDAVHSYYKKDPTRGYPDSIDICLFEARPIVLTRMINETEMRKQLSKLEKDNTAVILTTPMFEKYKVETKASLRTMLNNNRFFSCTGLSAIQNGADVLDVECSILQLLNKSKKVIQHLKYPQLVPFLPLTIQDHAHVGKWSLFLRCAPTTKRS